MSVTTTVTLTSVESYAQAYRNAYAEYVRSNGGSVDEGRALFQLVQALRDITLVQGVEIQMLTEQLERMERRP